MCGIAGFLDRRGNLTPERMRSVVTAMTDAIAHRGPDDSGFWADPAAGIALGQRRLSIIDLSAEGHQPMTSHGGDWIVVFNGGIYNFQELRKELEAEVAVSAGHSDTEIMLAAFEQWGVDAAMRRFNGMFAFALWNRRERTLCFCRDRLLSEEAALLWLGRRRAPVWIGAEGPARASRFSAEIDRDAVALYLRLGYIPAPYTIYRGIYKVPAAAHLTIGPRDSGANPPPAAYWSAREAAEPGLPTASAAWTTPSASSMRCCGAR